MKDATPIIKQHARLVKAYLDAASDFPEGDATRVILERVAGTLRLALSCAAGYFHAVDAAVKILKEKAEA